jgi:beta-glucosidase-like glycosyl hydrolase
MIVTPHRTTKLFILLLILLVFLLGYNYFAQPFIQRYYENLARVGVETAMDSDQGLESDQPWKLLSDRQKIAQLVAVPLNVSQILEPNLVLEVSGATLSETTNNASTSMKNEILPWFSDYDPGFVTLFGSDIGATAAAEVVSSIKVTPTAIGLPIWFAVDHEGGRVQRLNGEGFTQLPGWRQSCAQPTAEREVLLTQSAVELAAIGIDVVLAPVLDLSDNHPVLATRACSNDPAVVAQAAGEFVSAFSRVGILSVLKHFPGIGETKRDLHQVFDQVTVMPRDALLYRELLDRYPSTGVMVSHVGVLNQYPDIPCSLSSQCVGELLNNYPEVLIFSDALEMPAALYRPRRLPGQISTPQGDRTLPEAALEALLAGNDVLIFGDGVTLEQLAEVINYLEQEMAANPALRSQVEASLEKVVSYKQ